MVEQAEVPVVRIPSESCAEVTVKKVLEVFVDVGNLLASDSNDLDLQRLEEDKEKYLVDLSRDNAQILINKIWQLETDTVEGSIVAKLPKPTYILPREKPPPKPRPLTKWEEFAREKGIVKKKKGNLEWDDVLKKWVPRYGFKRAVAEKEKDWIIEVPGNADPFEDQFEKKKEVRAEKVSKNEFQRLRNIAKAKNIKVPSMGLPPTEKLSSKQLNSAALIANTSTASLGKFQPTVNKEKELKKNESILPTKKRKSVPYIPPDEERKKQLSIVDSLLNKRPKLDLDRAVKVDTSAPMREKSKKVKGGKSKKKDAGRSSKPKAGKGNRQFTKSNKGGRKRR